MTAAAPVVRNGGGVTPDALSGPLFLGSGIYRGSSYGATHPLRVPRVSTVMDLARTLGWLPDGRYRQSPRAKPAALTAYHTPAYIAALQQAEATGHVDPETRARHHLGTTSNPVFPEMFRRPATGAGGVILAAQLLATHATGAIHVPGGGTHHGLPDRANGFCYLNDPVLALMALRHAGLTRLAYVDIDAHHPDGVEPAFAGDPDMLMISVHEENRWPFTGQLTDTAGGSAFNLPVPRGFNDSEARAILHGLILPRLAAHRPQAIVLQAGADSACSKTRSLASPCRTAPISRRLPKSARSPRAFCCWAAAAITRGRSGAAGRHFGPRSTALKSPTACPTLPAPSCAP